jgi:hypothetical protein
LEVVSLEGNDNIKMDGKIINRIWGFGLDLFGLHHCRVLVKTVMNFQVPYRTRDFLMSWAQNNYARSNWLTTSNLCARDEYIAIYYSVDFGAGLLEYLWRHFQTICLTIHFTCYGYRPSACNSLLLLLYPSERGLINYKTLSNKNTHQAHKAGHKSQFLAGSCK